MKTDDCEGTPESIEIVYDADGIDAPPAPSTPEAQAGSHAERPTAPTFEETLPGIGVPPLPFGYGPG